MGILRFVAALTLLAAPYDSTAAPQEAASKSAAGGNAVTLSASGRTIAVSRDIPAGVLKIGVLDDRTPVTVCNDKKEFRPGPLKLRYLVLPDVSSPRELSSSEGEAAGDPVDGVFATRAVTRGSFVMFNLSRDPSPDRDAPILLTCWGSIRDAKGLQSRREDDVKSKEEAVKKTQALITTLRQRIESQRADAATFGGRGESAERIAETLKRVEETRGALTKAETELVTQQEELATAQEALADTPGEIRDNLGMSLSDAEYTVTALGAGSLLKVGGVLIGSSKGVYYDFASYSPRSSLQLMPIGDYPVVRYGERQFAVVANVISSEHSYGFFLAATAHDGAVVNTDPVRPTFPISAGEAAAAVKELPKRRATSRAYTDVVLPIRGTFAPNQYPEVTISTERAADDDPKKRTAVTLVDKAKYPQFRALYRYNFNTGVFASSLRSSEFTKVKTRDDDPLTEKVDESLYRIQTTASEMQVKPLFAFTYYVKPVDVQAPVSHERWIPNPTLGFAFANPADNIYFGFSHEVLRNAQVFYGWHWGLVKEAVARNEVSEDRDASAPLTREKRRAAFGVGATFNVAVITKIFK